MGFDMQSLILWDAVLYPLLRVLTRKSGLFRPKTIRK